MKLYALQATVLTAIASFIVVALFSLEIINESTMMTLIGIFGFPSAAALRAYIEEKGWKTYLFAFGGGLGVVALLAEWATPEQIGYWYSFWGIAVFGGLVHAVKKLKFSIFKA